MKRAVGIDQPTDGEGAISPARIRQNRGHCTTEGIRLNALCDVSLAHECGVDGLPEKGEETRRIVFDLPLKTPGRRHEFLHRQLIGPSGCPLNHRCQAISVLEDRAIRRCQLGE
jgi:hypothetical protein